MAYLITGLLEGEPFRTSRSQIASAVILAMRLTEEGYTGVAIVDLDGARLSLGEFQRRHRPELRHVRMRRAL